MATTAADKAITKAKAALLIAGAGRNSRTTRAATSPSTSWPAAASAPDGTPPPPAAPTRSRAVASSLAGRCYRARSSACISTSSPTWW